MSARRADLFDDTDAARERALRFAGPLAQTCGFIPWRAPGCERVGDHVLFADGDPSGVVCREHGLLLVTEMTERAHGTDPRVRLVRLPAAKGAYGGACCLRPGHEKRGRACFFGGSPTRRATYVEAPEDLFALAGGPQD